VVEFFREEYILNHLIFNAPKSQIALLNGITMGGGVGLSIPGRYRVATDRTMFAMPETGIGFFPDVGGSWFLPRLTAAKGAMGMFLALTGHRLKGKDVLAAGVATHFVEEARLDELEAALLGGTSEADVQATLAKFCPPTSGASYDDVLPQIEKCYGLDKKSVEEIVAALEADGSEWAVKQLATLHRMSPLSLKVTFRQMREGARHTTFGECLSMEFRMCVRVMQSGEFFEGVRCLLIDKEKTRAKWRYETLADVPEDVVAGHFAPLGPDAGCDELTF
jgi:enoyl-CoA hydratase/carnithine racemase